MIRRASRTFHNINRSIHPSIFIYTAHFNQRNIKAIPVPCKSHTHCSIRGIDPRYNHAVTHITDYFPFKSHVSFRYDPNKLSEITVYCRWCPVNQISKSARQAVVTGSVLKAGVDFNPAHNGRQSFRRYTIHRDELTTLQKTLYGNHLVSFPPLIVPVRSTSAEKTHLTWM